MLTLAGPAQASTTWETGDTLYYVASAGEANTLAVNLQGENATVQDAGYPAMGMVSPCRPWEVLMMDGLGALCPAAPVARVVLDLGDAPDSLSAGAMTGSPLPTAALGGPGNDRLWSWTGNDDLTGGPGQDDLSSNGGSDLIDARDGGADNVDCGDGSDVAIVDPTDNLTSCETLLTERPADRPAPVIPTPPEPTVTATRPTPVQVPTVPSVPTEERTPPPAVHLRLVVRSVSLRTARTAGLPVQATCGEGCQVSALVRVTRERARRFGVPRTLARVTRAGTAGGTARLRMRLRGAGLARVRLLHVTIHADAVTAAGQHLVQDIALTLRR
jgi:hypothetical protein